jgi:hypothetical protein
MENTAKIEDSPTCQDIMNKSARIFYQDMFAKMFLFSLWQILFYENSSLLRCCLYNLVNLKIIINGIILRDNTMWLC